MKSFIIFIILITISLSIAPNFGGVNQSSRFDLTKAIVLDHTFQIDKYVSNTEDWSKFDGHYYSNKAPGSSMLAAIPYFALTIIDKIIGNDSYSESKYLSFCIFFVTIIPFILILILTNSWLTKFQISNDHKNNIIFVMGFGSLATIFSTMFWGHVTSAFFIFASFYFFFVKKRGVLQGLFIGLAVLTEYTSALLIPILLILNFKEKKKELVLFLLGGLLPFLIFIYYHKIAFGGYFSLAPAFGNPVFGSDQKSSLSVFSFPSLKVFYELLLGFKRGIFIIVPVSALAIYGIVKQIKCNCSIEDKKLAYSVGISFILFILFNVSFVQGWNGGWASGPRYLVPVFPLVYLGLIYFETNNIFKLLAIFSAINVVTVYTVNVMARPEYNLLFEEVYPKIMTLEGNKIGILIVQYMIVICGWIVLQSKKLNSS